MWCVCELCDGYHHFGTVLGGPSGKPVSQPLSWYVIMLKVRHVSTRVKTFMYSYMDGIATSLKWTFGPTVHSGILLWWSRDATSQGKDCLFNDQWGMRVFMKEFDCEAAEKKSYLDCILHWEWFVANVELNPSISRTMRGKKINIHYQRWLIVYIMGSVMYFVHIFFSCSLCTIYIEFPKCFL